MEGILEGGHFSPPTPKLRVERERKGSRVSIIIFMFIFGI